MKKLIITMLITSGIFSMHEMHASEVRVPNSGFQGIEDDLDIQGSRAPQPQLLQPVSLQRTSCHRSDDPASAVDTASCSFDSMEREIEAARHEGSFACEAEVLNVR